MKNAKSVRKSGKNKAGSKHTMSDLPYKSIGGGTSVFVEGKPFEKLATLFSKHTKKNPQRYNPIYRRIEQNLKDILEGNPYHVKLTDIPKDIRTEVGEIISSVEDNG